MSLLVRRACPILLSVVALLLAGCRTEPAPPPGSPQSAVFDVRRFGAAGDGSTKDTAAFQRAIDAATAGGGIVDVPAGNYLIGSIQLKSNVTLRLAAGATLSGSGDANDYPLTTIRYEGEDVPGHHALVWAELAHNVAVVGPGTLAGSAAMGNLRKPRGPVMMEFTRCNNVRLDGFTDTYGHLWSIHLLFCQDVTLHNLRIRTSGSNGDGIDVDSTVGVIIDGCDIDSGDDCISLKSGRGLLAYKAARPTADVLIQNCTFGSGFAGVGIGSEMSGGVRHVRINHCIFVHGANALFLKSRTGRGGYLADIHASNVVAEHGVKVFLGIGLNNHGIRGTEPVPGAEGIPQVSDIVVANAQVHGVGMLVDGNHVADEKPIDGLTLMNISGTSHRGIQLANVNDAKLLNIHVRVEDGPLLATYHVSGVGLADAAPLPPPPSPRMPEDRNRP